MDQNFQSISSAVDALRQQAEGEVITPRDSDFDAARTLWNAMIDRRPVAILRCRSEADVIAGLKVARSANLPVSVRGGGHNIAGSALVDGGVVLDMSAMRDVEIDPGKRTASVAAGGLLSDLDEAAHRHGLAVPLGINSTTGVAGLTLGGGYGWLTRKYGLTVDNLLGVRLVTPNGQTLMANAHENPDLFWALRGGGGNFGVVLSFEYALHELSEVTAGLIFHKGEAAGSILRQLRDVSDRLPDELTVWAVLRKAPPLPFLAEEHHGAPVLVLACCWCGDAAAADAALEPVRAIGAPIAEAIGRQPYPDWQKAFDPLTGPGARNYWKSHMFDGLEDDLIDLFAEGLSRLPGEECEIFVAQLGGAPAAVGEGVTAYPHRSARFMMNLHARWQDPQDDTRCIAWAREFFDRTEAHAAGGVYSNFMPADETDRVRSAYGDSYERLSRLKALHDPENLLRCNINVKPAA